METQEHRRLLLSEKFRLMHDIVSRARGVLLVTHAQPDSDGVGSMIALHRALEHSGINSFPYAPDLPAYLSFLPGIRDIKTTLPEDPIDCVIGLDYGDIRRLPIPKEFLVPPRIFITLDHHVRAGPPASASSAGEWRAEQEGTLCIVEPESAATACLVFQYFQDLSIPMDAGTATCLLAGIFGDTGGFRHTNTSAEILQTAAELFSRGASIFHIAQATIPKRTARGVHLWASALSGVVFEEETELLYSHLAHEEILSSGADLSELFGFVNFLNAAPEARVAAFFVEREPGRIKGELRTEPHRDIDVSVIASELGGGGHRLAAGFETPRALEEVVGTVRTGIREQLKSSGPVAK